MPARVTAVESTDLFIGTEDEPRQVVRVGVAGAGPAAAVAVTGPGVETPEPATVDGAGTVEVGVRTGAAPGESVPVEVTVDGAVAGAGTLEVAEPGWTMVMVNHFHYDPVWWNTQAAYTSEWRRPELTDQHEPRGMPGFALVRAHLELAARDPDYTFVLAELDYLKPFRDVHPERRAELAELLAAGRLELMGGTYNEPNTNLTAAETTVRNLVYGIGYQRGVVGGDPATAWQLDAFGHDPQFPGMAADAGLTSSSWARGPFHQWGPMMKSFHEEPGDATVMQFPADFEWISPSGRGVLTAYMANHYAAGWWMDSAPDLDEAVAETYKIFRALKPVAATRNILLPVGTDYTPPNRWVTKIHRHFAERYVWPRFVSALPKEFFARVRAEMGADGRTASPQSRDMNPIYTGKDVSYIDTKQAHRAGEQATMEAERFATLASLHGDAFPHEELDSSWRQLAYGAHHDAVTGSESDQVYLDLMTGWREALDRSTAVRDTALRALAARTDITGGDLPVTVYNGQSWTRTDVVTAEIELPAPGVRALAVDGGGPVLVDNASRHPDGSLRTATVAFLAEDVPGVGYRTVHLVPADTASGGWAPVDGVSIASGAFAVTADPARGGGLSSVRDASGRELVAAGEVANELVVYDEYPEHPQFKEGPWHLVPSGGRSYARDTAATVRAERSVLGERLVVSGSVGPVRYTQYVTLYHGVGRIDLRTRVDEFTGEDKLVRVRFPSPVPGALPVSEVGDATIGRGFGLIDVDSAEHPYTLDNPAYTWFGLSSTARIEVTAGDRPVSIAAERGAERARSRPGERAGDRERTRAIGIAELVCPDGLAGDRVRPLVVALAGRGVTATTSRAGGSRYGLLDVDSNLPDVRVVVGGPDLNPFAAEVLSAAGDSYADEVAKQLADTGRARVFVPAAAPLSEVWRPGADLRAPDALDVLIVAGSDAAALDAELAAVVDDLSDNAIAVRQQAPAGDGAFEHRTVGLLNRGIPGFAVTTDGGLHLSLMRSCTGWPSGVWIDPPRRTAPDGSAFQLQHWTHELDYAFVSGDGDWRDAGLVAAGQGFNNPLHAVTGAPHDGALPGTGALVTVEPADRFVLTTLKPTGNPLAAGSAARPSGRDGLTVRGYDATGAGGPVRIGTVVPVTGGYAADLLERPGAALAVAGGAAVLETGSSDVVTAVLAVDTTGLPADPMAGPAPAATLPEYSRYWLHNSGPAPLGYQQVAVHVHPTRARAGAPLRVTVASDVTDAPRTGTVRVVPPDGWDTGATVLPYELAPGGHAEFELTATPPAGTAPGRYPLAVRITEAGREQEDVAILTVPAGDPTPEPSEAPAEIPSDARNAQLSAEAVHGGDAGFELELTGTEVRTAPGGTATVTAELRNGTGGELHVRVWAVSPYDTWGWVTPRQRDVAVPAHGTATVRVDVAPPAGAPAYQGWLLLKAAGAGEVRYSPTVPLLVEPS